MGPTGWIALWAALFALTHSGIASAAVRPRLIEGFGELPYRGLYSLISLATIIPLIIEYFRHKHAGPILWMLGGVAPIRWLAVVLAFLGLLIVIAGFANPNPAGIAGEMVGAGLNPRGLLKVTRHPMFVGLGLWAVAHMIVNGSVADLLFFGTFAVVGIFGAMHQDRRKLAEVGEPYRRFHEQTSLIPGLALLDGRQRIAAREMPWAAIAIGAVALAILLALHPILFGGNPLG
jgi:uncharacterized membrane protein